MYCGFVVIGYRPHFSSHYGYDRRTSRICFAGVVQKQQICDCYAESFRQRVILPHKMLFMMLTLFKNGLSGCKILVACLKQEDMNNADT